MDNKRSRRFFVSIHASSREDATTASILELIIQSFNPRVLAGGRDKLMIYYSKLERVSIHASSREDATPRRQH